MTTARGKRAALALVLSIVSLAAFAAGAVAAPLGGEAQLSFQPASHDFGLQQLYSGAQTSFQLRNEGEVEAPVYSLETIGPDSGSFWVGGSDCYGKTLEPGESCSIQVYFNPGEVRAYEAQVRVMSAEGATFTAALSGEGGRPVFTPASEPTNFSSIAVGAPAVTRTIDVTNTGNMPGGVFIAVISGGAVGSFHLLDENCTGTPLYPSSTCNAVVSFQPISTGSKTARLSLFGESEGGTQITLTGVGLEADPPAVTETPRSPAVTQPAAAPAAKSSTRKRRAHHHPRRNRTLKRAHRRHRRAALAERRAIR